MPRRNKSKTKGKAEKYRDRPFADLERELRSKQYAKNRLKGAP